jgi:hypothetical protein
LTLDAPLAPRCLLDESGPCIANRRPGVRATDHSRSKAQVRGRTASSHTAAQCVSAPQLSAVDETSDQVECCWWSLIESTDRLADHPAKTPGSGRVDGRVNIIVMLGGLPDGGETSDMRRSPLARKASGRQSCTACAASVPAPALPSQDVEGVTCVLTALGFLRSAEGTARPIGDSRIWSRMPHPAQALLEEDADRVPRVARLRSAGWGLHKAAAASIEAVLRHATSGRLETIVRGGCPSR